MGAGVYELDTECRAIGERSVWQEPKVAFVCSRKIVSGCVTRCFDWALEQRERGLCVMSGCHSPIERDIFDILLRGRQPLILVLARGMKQRFAPEIQAAIEAGRLLVISPFEDSVRRVSERSAYRRNEFMAAHADRIVAGYMSKGGSLRQILQSSSKPIEVLWGG